jgi:ribosome-associated heat shock protein Hsp15
MIPSATVNEIGEVVRVDKWLWAARLFKTRTLAAAACHGGKVDVNHQAAKPSRLLRAGDTVQVTVERGRRVVRVAALADRRGPATAARTLYDDLTPPAPPRIRAGRPAYRAPGTGRPTKSERRAIDRLRGG